MEVSYPKEFKSVRIRVVVLLLFSALVGAFTPNARAEGESGTDLSLFVGYLLPNQIEGITEIMPLFGGRYGIGFIEFTAENSHAMGADWTSFGLNFRGELPITSGINALVYGGPDIHYYIPINDVHRRTDYGLHFGVAGLMLVTESLWLRSDLRFNGNPGTSLSLLFGLMFR